jgi:hypothetical protein
MIDATGSGTAQIRLCGNNKPVRLKAGNSLVFTCSDPTIRVLAETVEVLQDDDAVITLLTGTTARIIENAGQQFTVEIDPVTAAPALVSLGVDTVVTVFAGAITTITEIGEDKFEVENSEESLQSIMVEIDGQVIEYIAGASGIPVSIDIKPGSFPNSINIGSKGGVPVALFSTSTFDATTVDPTTVTLASAPVKLKGKGTPQASFEDVDGDGLQDLVVHVDTTSFEISDTDEVASLEGLTFGGTSIMGSDTIRVVP